MAIPWKTLESISTEAGTLELRQRGERDFLITIGRQVLMNSTAHRSEVALGKLACEAFKHHTAPDVLVSGLGMGFTLKAVLDVLPTTARVAVAELNPVVPEWCHGAMALLTDNAICDPRVTVEITDVADLIKRSHAGSFDAIVLDMYTGPSADSNKRDDPLYGSHAIERTKKALKPGGIFAIWGENHDQGFEKRLTTAGFRVTTERPGRGGLRHVVYIARL